MKRVWFYPLRLCSLFSPFSSFISIEWLNGWLILFSFFTFFTKGTGFLPLLFNGRVLIIAYILFLRCNPLSPHLSFSLSLSLTHSHTHALSETKYEIIKEQFFTPLEKRSGAYEIISKEKDEAFFHSESKGC